MPNSTISLFQIRVFIASISRYNLSWNGFTGIQSTSVGAVGIAVIAVTVVAVVLVTAAMLVDFETLVVLLVTAMLVALVLVVLLDMPLQIEVAVIDPWPQGFLFEVESLTID
ncbi:hypothetical protein B0T18DRAFT_394084 [Schizothecium vesticola]|uniref:Uncharacterized protein n=1 Tax=Schizothecium vesticola TaxID=314040 RepID=A0AA40ELG3_9PEZI|nr:hypothetical protein B0T18DRAFT_394084 [Schizothecium vesticola]